MKLPIYGRIWNPPLQYRDSGIIEFDCTDVGDYTLMIESRNISTGQIFEYGINFKVVDTSTTLENFGYFMLGMWDGTVEAGKGVWSVVRHPIKTGKSFVNGTAFIAKALVTNGEEREALYCIWTTSGMEMLSNLEADEAKDTARKVGKFTAQILLAVVAEKGIAKATTALKESAKSGKLSKVSQSWTKTGQKADDFVTGLIGKNSLVNIFKNGKIFVDDIKANPKLFSGNTVDDYVKALQDAGYDASVRTSTSATSKAQIIQVHNAGSGRNITQFQVSPGGGRHGELPYVKISTSDQGKIKIVDGFESMYKTDGAETATIIFTGGN